MESARWLVLSPLVVAIAAGALGPGRLQATVGGEPAWDPPPCAMDGSASPIALTWYRLEPVLDRSGTLAARRLVVGVDGRSPRTMDLEPESFASGPVGGLVLAGEDDGAMSRLRLVDPARGCATAVAEEMAVIRSAVLTADGQSLYEHRVDRATRADLGVWRRPVGGAAERVLDGLAPDPHLGPTFSTSLVPSPDGRLTVSSCAPAGCRVRVLDPATGEVATVRDIGPGLGPVGGSLVALAACPGLPCPVVAVNFGSGRRTTLVAAALGAALGGPNGDQLVLEVEPDRIVVVDVAGGRVTARPERGTPLPRGSTSTAGAEGPAGRVAIVRDAPPDGRAIGLLDPRVPPSRRQPGADR